jgi:chromatin remodeling complex protein RSC6
LYFGRREGLVVHTFTTFSEVQMGRKRAKKKTVRRKKTARRRPAKKKAAKRRVKKAKKRVVRRKKKKRAKRKPNPAFMKPVKPDAKLAEVVGATPLPRTQLTKKLWTYIKRHRLQDSKNRRMINADAKLKPVFNGKSKVSMFEMTKLVNKHVK